MFHLLFSASLACVVSELTVTSGPVEFLPYARLLQFTLYTTRPFNFQAVLPLIPSVAQKNMCSKCVFLFFRVDVWTAPF